MLFIPKNLGENGITEIDLLGIINNGIEESIHLEYKRQLNDNEKIAKTLSSFANSDGGNVIYGIVEEEHKPVEINPLESKSIREKIDQITHNNIDPPLNIKIWPVDVEISGKKGQVFVIYIPKKYPYLHFEKSSHKFYKRTNFTSTPMERYEIEQAFDLVAKNRKALNQSTNKVEKEFVDLIGKHNLEMRLIISPVRFGEKLFQITKEIYDLIMFNVPQTPNFNNNVINRSNLSWGEDFRVNDYFFPYFLGHPASCIIKENGIIIYNLSYVILEEFELKDFYRENEINDKYQFEENPAMLIEKGIFYEQEDFHREINADYFMGFLDFISKLYNNVSYSGDLLFIFKAIGIEHCKDYHVGSSFRQKYFEPIEKIYSQEIIRNTPSKVIKDFFNPILAGFGYLPIDLDTFNSHVKHNTLIR